MVPSTLFTSLLFLLVPQLTLSDISDVGLSPPQMIENHGYPSETHFITTEDGYILTFHRIPHGINDTGTAGRPAVLVMHGLTSSSADYVSMGPGRSLGYIMADAGYDVWLGNERGNAFSRNHTTIDVNINPEKFFNFTWHEMGIYDLPNSIDYILNLKGDDSLYYLGHSQGTTIFMVMASTKPDYNRKIRIASLMAAAAIVKHFNNLFVQTLVKYTDIVEVLLDRYKIYEVPYVAQERNFVSTFCADPSSDPLCDVIYNSGFPEHEVEKDLLPVIYSNFPSNAAMKPFIQYGQQVRDGGFRYFDYGPEKNLEVYGSEAPPDYDFSKITAPVAIYYAKNDVQVTVQDEETLISLLPNVVNHYLVPADLFNHRNFVFHKDAVNLVYNELLDVMASY